MLLSIIVPVYNVKEYLEKCVNSVIPQLENDCEIILIDDGSTDGVSPQICDSFSRKYPNMIRTIHKENGGPGAARNEGIKTAKGEYICFLDSDDYLKPHALSQIRQTIQTFAPDVIQFGYEMEKDGVIIDVNNEDVPTNQLLSFNDYPRFFTMPPTVWNRVWHRTLFTENEIWFPAHVWYEDLRTVPKLFAKANGIVVVPEALYVYVQREGSIMHNDNIERNFEIIDAFTDLVSWFKTNHLYDSFYNVLSKMATFHLLIFAGTRVARQDPSSDLLNQLHGFMQATFPDYMRNPTLDFWHLPIFYKVMLVLMNGRHYKLIRLLYLGTQR